MFRDTHHRCLVVAGTLVCGHAGLGLPHVASAR